MPHVIVKMYPGRSRDQKKLLADKLTQDVVDITGCKQQSVSVAIEEVEPDSWPEAVYKPDILEGAGTLYKEPGYNPFETESKQDAQTENLMAYVRSRSEAAMLEDTTGYFNPMSWLDLELEDNPQSFDGYFDRPWDELTDQERADRAMAIRRVL